MPDNHRGDSNPPEADVNPKQPREVKRDALSESERIQNLRERLYSRGKPPEVRERHSLMNETPQGRIDEELPVVKSILSQRVDIRRAGEAQASTDSNTAFATPVAQIQPLPQTDFSTIDTLMQKKRSRSYRLKLALAGAIFFVGAILVSGGFLFFGNNTVSGGNISVDVSGPLTVNGGESMSFQVAVANQNTIPIESATLIIEYPQGTQSASEPGKEIFTERKLINQIGQNEVVNVPLRAIIFGQENEEKTINITIEYRIAGSSATFSKDAPPFKFKISSSPVTLRVETVKSISSGQEVTLTLSLESNSPTEISDLLIKALYPYGFDFNSAEPKPVSGEDTWTIKSLKPGEKKTISINGIVTGKESEIPRFTFNVGVPSEKDKLNLTSALTNAEVEISIEQPFLGIGVTVNGKSDDVVVISSKENANIRISFINTLEGVIYDGVIKAELSGNALNEVRVRVQDGFYDSTTDTITWDGVDTPALKEIIPGKDHTVTFSLEPDSSIGSTPEVRLKITVEGKRVSESRVPEQLVGSVERTIKVESVSKLTSSALYSEGPFTNTGPTPPVAEKVTQYTYLLSVDSGKNDITGAEVTAVLPQYVRWLDLVNDNKDVTYDATTRTIKWNVGNMNANAHSEVWMQVAFLPSLSQVGTTPTILETQRFKATDRFTGTTVRADAPALTTALINDPDRTKSDGKVRKE